MGRGKPISVKFSRATADVNPPEAPLEPIFDDKSGKKRVTGPIGFAIDGKNETAWGIDVGPGRRNQPRKAVFTAEKPVSFPGGTILTFHLAQNHGGWNSDDNQNYNLGRFRLAITTAPAATADPVPQTRPGDPGDPARETDRCPDGRRVQLSGGRRSRNGTEPTRGSIRSGSSIPRDRPNWRSRNASKRRPTHLLQRGDFLKPGKTVEPGVPSFLNPLPPGAPATRLTFARWLVDREFADDGSIAGQSGLASLLRDRAGRHQRRPGPAMRPAVASRAARLAGGRIHGEWLEPQALAPADRDVGGVPAIVAADARAARRETRITACWLAGRGRGSTPSWCATSPWRPVECSIPRSAAPVSVRRHLRSCSSRRPVMARRSGTRRPVPSGIGAPSTRSAIGRCRIRCCRRSTPPTAILPACAARDPIRRCRR